MAHVGQRIGRADHHHVVVVVRLLLLDVLHLFVEVAHPRESDDEFAVDFFFRLGFNVVDDAQLLGDGHVGQRDLRRHRVT